MVVDRDAAACGCAGGGCGEDPDGADVSGLKRAVRDDAGAGVGGRDHVDRHRQLARDDAAADRAGGEGLERDRDPRPVGGCRFGVGGQSEEGRVVEAGLCGGKQGFGEGQGAEFVDGRSGVVAD